MICESKAGGMFVIRKDSIARRRLGIRKGLCFI